MFGIFSDVHPLVYGAYNGGFWATLLEGSSLWFPSMDFQEWYEKVLEGTDRFDAVESSEKTGMLVHPS